LNVTHSALCYVGSLASLTNVHEAVTHKMIKPYLRRLMNEEIAASLRADPTMPEELLAVLDEYTELVLSRFENVAVKDTLDRVAMDGSEKFRVQGREVIMERLAREGSVRGFALYVASWAHFLRRSVRDGEKIRDASAGLIAAPWNMDKENTGVGTQGLEAFLDIEEVFGVLARHEGWREAVKREFADIDATGLEATLLGAIFGVGHNSNADLSSMGLERSRERASGTFALDETCVVDTHETEEWRADDEAAVFVSLEA
jgi:mannitol 2-dehydrogenase